MTLKEAVNGVKCPAGLESSNKHFPTMLCVKSPFGKFKFAAICPAVVSASPGTLKLVTPPITMPAWPSVKVNCCASQSAASITPLVFASRYFCTTTVSPLARPVTWSVIGPL